MFTILSVVKSAHYSMLLFYIYRQKYILQKFTYNHKPFRGLTLYGVSVAPLTSTYNRHVCID